MAASVAFQLLFISAILVLRSVSATSLCPLQSALFLSKLQSQCPLSFLISAPAEVDGESLDKVLGSSQMKGYTSVLFYASWCPFSCNARSSFDILSSMFPQITHLAVEESSVMPAVLSRYGVHSFPTIFIANRTSRMRYYGSKDLSSLRLFYKRITSLQPVEYSIEDQPSSLGSEKPNNHVWDSSPREILTREPYLVFSLLFLCLKAFIYLFPDMLSHLKSIWVSYGWHQSLGFFGDTSQLLERVLHVINVKRAWSKLRRCKTGNFQNGAKNAHVWASSLASVSLGESSSTRLALLDS